MKIHKLLVLLTAMALSTTVFAGNSSSNSAMIKESVSAAAEAVQDEEVSEEVLQNTTDAILAGLLQLDEDNERQELTENDKAILNLMEQKIPAILNKIQTTSDEVAEELDPVLKELTTLVLKNQTLFSEKQIDFESAKVMLFLTTINNADIKDLISDRVSQILAVELLLTIVGQ